MNHLFSLGAHRTVASFVTALLLALAFFALSAGSALAAKGDVTILLPATDNEVVTSSNFEVKVQIEDVDGHTGDVGDIETLKLE